MSRSGRGTGPPLGREFDGRGGGGLPLLVRGARRGARGRSRNVPEAVGGLEEEQQGPAVRRGGHIVEGVAGLNVGSGSGGAEGGRDEEWKRSHFVQGTTMSHFMNDLINTLHPQLLGSLSANDNFAIIIGQTGCGKSSLVPITRNKINHGSKLTIVVGPKRIPAIKLANYVESLLGNQGLVGYKISGEEEKSASTRILFVTAGWLLVKITHRPDYLLNKCSSVIIDEVHDPNTDTLCLVTYLKKLRKGKAGSTFPSLILMSATINANFWAEYFYPHFYDKETKNPVTGSTFNPVIDVSPGLNKNVTVTPYFLDDIPVEKSYYAAGARERFLTDEREEEEISPKLHDEFLPAAYDVIEIMNKKDENLRNGMILVFLPGVGEIEKFINERERRPVPDVTLEMRALHGQLPSSEQQEIVTWADADLTETEKKKRVWKVVVATNICESSITFKRCNFVINFGLTKLSGFDFGRQIKRLDTQFCTRDQNIQRMGRAGRVEDGICFHMMTKYWFNKDHPQLPETSRIPLEEVVLSFITMKYNQEFGGQEGFVREMLNTMPYPPKQEIVDQTIRNLLNNGSIKFRSQRTSDKDVYDRMELTWMGNLKSGMPIDSHIVDLMVAGMLYGCFLEGVILAAEKFKGDRNLFKSSLSSDEINAITDFSRRTFSDQVAKCVAVGQWGRDPRMKKKKGGSFKNLGAPSIFERAENRPQQETNVSQFNCFRPGVIDDIDNNFGYLLKLFKKNFNHISRDIGTHLYMKEETMEGRRLAQADQHLMMYFVLTSISLNNWHLSEQKPLKHGGTNEEYPEDSVLNSLYLECPTQNAAAIDYRTYGHYLQEILMAPMSGLFPVIKFQKLDEDRGLLSASYDPSSNNKYMGQISEEVVQFLHKLNFSKIQDISVYFKRQSRVTNERPDNVISRFRLVESFKVSEQTILYIQRVVTPYCIGFRIKAMSKTWEDVKVMLESIPESSLQPLQPDRAKAGQFVIIKTTEQREYSPLCLHYARGVIMSTLVSVPSGLNDPVELMRRHQKLLVTSLDEGATYEVPLHQLYHYFSGRTDYGIPDLFDRKKYKPSGIQVCVGTLAPVQHSHEWNLDAVAGMSRILRNKREDGGLGGIVYPLGPLIFDHEKRTLHCRDVGYKDTKTGIYHSFVEKCVEGNLARRHVPVVYPELKELPSASDATACIKFTKSTYPPHTKVAGTEETKLCVFKNIHNPLQVVWNPFLPMPPQFRFDNYFVDKSSVNCVTLDPETIGSKYFEPLLLIAGRKFLVDKDGPIQLSDTTIVPRVPGLTALLALVQWPCVQTVVTGVNGEIIAVRVFEKELSNKAKLLFTIPTSVVFDPEDINTLEEVRKVKNVLIVKGKQEHLDTFDEFRQNCCNLFRKTRQVRMPKPAAYFSRLEDTMICQMGDTFMEPIQEINSNQ